VTGVTQSGLGDLARRPGEDAWYSTQRLRMRVGEQLLDLRFDDGGLGGADVAGGDLSVAVDHKSDGQTEDSAVSIREFGIAQRDWIIHFELLLKLANGRLAVVHGNAEDLQTLRGVLVLQLNEVGNFLLAGFAPGGPEIQHDDFAAVVRQAEVAAGEIGERKVGSGAQGARVIMRARRMSQKYPGQKCGCKCDRE